MNEENGTTAEEQTDSDIDFAFAVVKGNNGHLMVKPVEGEATLDDIYGACAIVMRNIEAQHQANAIQQAVAAQAMSQQQSKGKVIVPEGVLNEKAMKNA